MDERYPEETKTLQELLALMHEHDLDTIKVRLGDAVYELSRRADPPMEVPQASAIAASPQSAPLAFANASKVVAPLTGVFYRASSPESVPYVELGARVETGDVLCVLEAMKLFNEIQSDYAGTIVRIVPGNGELVSQGQELFWIEPHS
jgi:acetyl-CoA carboxylase biotin carboxyl carrier protein